MEEKRKAFNLKISSPVREKVDAMYKEAGCRSRAEFIERAIEFYCGYLSSEEDQAYVLCC